MTDYDLSHVCRRLDAIILLLLENASGSADSTTRKIEKLVDLGFSQSDVANIIGKKLNYVTAIVSQKKNRSPKRKSVTAGVEGK